jgi:hypothetical protein
MSFLPLLGNLRATRYDGISPVEINAGRSLHKLGQYLF